MEKLKEHSPDEYVPKSILALEKKVNEIIEKLIELQDKVDIIERLKRPSKEVR